MSIDLLSVNIQTYCWEMQRSWGAMSQNYVIPLFGLKHKIKFCFHCFCSLTDDPQLVSWWKEHSRPSLHFKWLTCRKFRMCHGLTVIHWKDTCEVTELAADYTITQYNVIRYDLTWYDTILYTQKAKFQPIPVIGHQVKDQWKTQSWKFMITIWSFVSLSVSDEWTWCDNEAWMQEDTLQCSYDTMTFTSMGKEAK